MHRKFKSLLFDNSALNTNADVDIAEALIKEPGESIDDEDRPPARKFIIINWRDILDPKAGGAERYCYEMAQRLVKDGVRVTWISSAFPNSKRTEYYDGIEIVRRGNVFSVYLAMIGEFIGRRKNAIVLESVNAIPFLSSLFSRKSKTVMIHHLIPYSVFREKLGPLAPIAFFLQNFINPVLYKKARVITNSESTRVELLKQGYRDVNIVKTGVDRGFYNPSIKMNYIVAPGPLRPWKNHADIITAVSRLPDKYHLFLFGSAETQEFESLLKRTSERLGIRERTHFLGRITEEEKAKLLSISKLSMGASVKEGWGLSNMESQAYGCPVVAYDVAGVRDSVRNNVTGRLVQYGNVNAMVSNALELLEDESLLRNYSERSKAWADNFLWDRCYGEFVATVVRNKSDNREERPNFLLERLSWLRTR